MKSPARFLLSVCGSVALLTTLLGQSPAPKVEFPQASPASTVKQRVGLTDIEIVYSRPSVKGRKIFGGLEPFGAVWRTGANSPTRITFSTPVKFGGTEVPAGAYGLFSIPGEREWTVILSKIDAKDWGAYNYKAENDVARARVKPTPLKDSTETFLIDINDILTETANLNLIWASTKVSVPLRVDTVSKVKSQVDGLMASDSDKTAGQYFSSAMFYFENNVNLPQALKWMDAGLQKQPDAFYMVYRKGLILEKMGDKSAARAAATASREAALKDKRESLRDEYVRLNDTLLARLK